jgi:hypothetical protein
MKEAVSLVKNQDKVVIYYKKIAIASLCLLGLSSFLSVFLMYKYSEKQSAHVYLARDFSSVERVTDERAMISQHVKNFYSLFFEADQSSFKARTEDALYLVGQSGVELRNRFSEAGWYRQIVQNNVILSVDVDSIAINMDSYPYEVSVKARQNVVRESGSSTRHLDSKFRVIKVANSEKNPFGLRIDNFIITDNTPYVAVK